MAAVRSIELVSASARVKHAEYAEPHAFARVEQKMQSLVRVTCTLAALALLSWALVLVVSFFGVSFLNGEAHTFVAVLAVIVTALAMDLPRRWVEKRRVGDSLMMQSSTALLLELPGFAGAVAAGVSVAWSQDISVAVVASLFVSVWAVAAPLTVRARSRSGADRN